MCVGASVGVNAATHPPALPLTPVLWVDVSSEKASVAQAAESASEAWVSRWTADGEFTQHT